MKAIIVDDSRAMRMLLKKILRGLGFEDLWEAEDGREGLNLLREKGKMDLALVDWNMPEMNGFEFLQAVRSDASYKEMRLVMITSETETSQMSKALEAGANEYVMKPFNKEILCSKLALMGLGPPSL